MFQGFKNHFLLKKDSHAGKYFIFITKRLIIKGIPNYAILKQFLNEGWFPSWCLSYSLTKDVPVHPEDSISNVKINVDYLKNLYSHALSPKYRSFWPFRE
jgi:hypothetical protein